MLNFKKYFNASYHQPYPSVYFLSPILLLVVHGLIIFEEDYDIGTIMANWGYYRALLFSWAVSLWLMYWVRKESIKLDALMPWHVYFVGRLKQQLLRGVVFPLLFAAFLATGYFAILKDNIIHTVYFSRYLPLMVLLLLLLNVMAFGWNQYFRRNPYVRNKRAVARLQLEGHIAASDIACVYVADGACHYRTAKGEHFAWTGTFEEAELQLGTAFFSIRRGVLISRANIVDVLPEGKLLKVVLAFEVPVSLVVSHRQLVAFKRWLAQE